MARPHIFISSTFFDLRQVRADLERFVKELGYDTVRNEMGNIPYGREEKLEEYCYKEISEVDILVGIVGGRFGSESNAGHYSITQTEIKTAIEQNKQVYIFIDKNVLSEYNTYLLNKDVEAIKYRYADDKRIYEFIEEIYSLPKNNIVHGFETALDITSYLREQWAGLFRDLLSQQARKHQFDNISLKVNELNEVSNTLKTYLENVLTSVSKEKNTTKALINREEKRLSNFQLKQRVENNPYIRHLIRSHKVNANELIDKLQNVSSLSEFHDFLTSSSTRNDKFLCLFQDDAISDLNESREILGLKPFDITDEESAKIKVTQRESRKRKFIPKNIITEDSKEEESEIPE